MKTTNRFFKGIALLFFLISASIFSQEEPQLYVNVTTMYWNMDLEEFSTNEWKAVEMEYHEKVTMKNNILILKESA